MTTANISVSGTGESSHSVRSVTEQPVHPLGSKANVLLCSVFGPYAQDDEYGSRVINPMELWHNQVTRVQGPFSLRMFHRSWGLMLIQANLEARCTCLDFPSRDRFIAEIRDNAYDIIGISGIVPNLGKVKEMCRLIRKYRPQTTIVIGGHIAGLADLADRIDADHIVRGEGVRWFRAFLGEDIDRPMRHPQIWSGLDRRTMGMRIPSTPATSAATLIPSVGCPIGCNFCATSAMFGGKGKVVKLFSSAESLFAVMSQLEEAMKIHTFFVMDENFLLNRPRAMKLLELMREHEKPWDLYVFSSANAINQYSMEELVSLGVSWIWLGMEGKGSQYGKLKQTDTVELVGRLQEHGIRVLGSTIIGLEEHTPENIDQAIDHAVSHNVDFHQFMLYTSVAGTPLHAEHAKNGTLLGPDEIEFEDTHGQYRFNFRHAHITDGQETEYLLRAFETDFKVNGPSVLRVVRTAIKGWKKHRNHPERRVRERFAREVQGVRSVFAGALWAAKRWFGDNKPLSNQLGELLRELCDEFGIGARLAAPVMGRVFYWSLRAEAKRMKNGWTREPPTFYEHNFTDPRTDSTATIIQSVPGLAEEAGVVASSQ